MEFMGFHIIDITIVALIAFLAIKGLVNGFTKEILNFIAIVGGVLLAARYNSHVITFINEQNLGITIPEEFAKLIGFIIIILAVFIVVSLLSTIISSLTSKTTSFLSRVAGYILSAGRYIFIFSLIIFGVSQSDFFEKSATQFKEETKLFKPMSEIGMQVLNIDINETVNSVTEKVEKSVNTKVETESNNTAEPSITITENNHSN
jgi:uncharacterized membrane protein required for colicin V production